MQETVRKQVETLLRSYPELLRKVELLRYELNHSAAISPQEMMEAMAFAKSDGMGHGAGGISNKTLYIAMSYQDAAEHINMEAVEELVERLVPMERTLHRLEHHLRLLSTPEQEVIRLCYFEQKSLPDAAQAMSTSVWAVRKQRDAAVTNLANMCAFVAGPNL